MTTLNSSNIVLYEGIPKAVV